MACLISPLMGLCPSSIPSPFHNIIVHIPRHLIPKPGRDLDEAALSRFSRRIHVPLPDKTTRSQLIQKALNGVACDLTQDQFLQLAEKLTHYSGRDLVAVCR